MRKAMAIGILLTAAAVAGCHQIQDDGHGGATVQRNYTVGPFQQIEVAGPYQVDVQTGGSPTVSATGPQKVLDRLVVEVNGDKLFIHPKEQHGFLHFGWHSNGNATVRVTAPALNAATIAGSGGIAIDKVAGNAFEGSVAGSGDLTLGELNVQSAKLSIGGSGNIRANGGQAATVDYNIGGSGDIDARALRAQTANVSIAGSGSIRGQATATADVSIMGSGDVTLTGGAKCNVSKMGSGSAHCS